MWIDPKNEVFFVTINGAVRNENQLAHPDLATALFQTVRHRQTLGEWWPHLFLLMPDHVHALLSFPPSRKSIQQVVSQWKEWTAKSLRLRWQRDFFEHRLRSTESRREKAQYILENPVRKGLVADPQDWPFVFFGDEVPR